MPRPWITRLFDKRSRKPIRFAPRLTHLEGRDVPATFFVDPDAVDVGGTGTWNEGRPDQVTGPFETGVDGSVYNDLSSAIAAANALAGADTIRLSFDDSIFFVDSAADTPVAITDSLDVIGFGAGVSIIQTDPANNQPTAVLVVQGAGVVANFTDVSFFGGAGGFDPAGTGDVIPNDSITGRFLRYETGTSGTIDRAVISGVFAPTFLGIGISAVGAGTDVTVQNSTFSDIGRVGVAAGTGANLTLTNNTYTGKGAGLFVDVFAQLVDGATATITGNTVTNNQGIDSNGDQSAAVIISQGGGAASTATITGNTFTGNSFGVIVGDNAADTSTADIQQNNLQGNLAAIATNRDGTTPVTAPNNFYGGTGGPFNATTNPTGTGSDVSDDVTFAPFSNTPFPQPAPTPVGVATTADASEPATPGNFRFTRTGDTTAPLTVNYTVGGTAVAGTDYVALPGSVTFAAGQATVDVPVTPISRPGFQGTRTVSVTITPDAALNVVNGTSQLSIFDNESAPTPTPVGVAATADAAEPATPGNFQFTRTGDTTAPLTVNYTVGGTAVAGTDYTALPGSVTFAAGQSTVDVPVIPIDRPGFQGTRTVSVTITPDAGITVVNGTSQVSIIDDDAAPTPTPVGVATTQDATEPSTAGNFRFTRTGDTTTPLTVNYTVGGSAVAGTDYTALPGSVTFAAGQTTVDVPVNPISRPGFQGTRTVSVTITPDAAITVVSGTSQLNIIDNETAPTPTPVGVATTADASEPTTPGNFRFTRTGDTSVALTVNYTIGGTAVAGTDYTALPGSVTFAAGQTTVDVPVTPISRPGVQGTRTVSVTITPATGISVVNGTSQLSIFDNEAPPVLPVVTVQSTTDATAPTTPGNIRFTRTGDTTAALTVNYTVGGTAVAGTDYVALPGSVTFPAGQATVDVPVNPLASTATTPRTVVVTLTAGSNFTSSGGPATVTINPGPVQVTTDSLLVTGPGTAPAQLFVPANGRYPTTGQSVTAFPGFSGTVRGTTGDVNGDGVDDLIFVTGPGTPARFTVISGADATTVLVPATDPFGSNFTGGGFVAAGDFDGDGRADIVITPDQGGGPNVVIYEMQADGTLAAPRAFFALGNPTFRGGARVAAGDINGDGVPDLAVAAGFLGGPAAEIHNGTAIAANDFTTLIGGGFFIFPGSDAETLRNGAFIAIGDLDGDGFGDLIGGGGPGGGPRVLALGGRFLSTGDVAGAYANPVANFFAGNPNSRGGIRVAAKDVDGDTRADLVVGSGEGESALARVYFGSTIRPSGDPTGFQDLNVFSGATLLGGVFVG